MPRLLLVNPNTSSSVTARLEQAAVTHFSRAAEVVAVTAGFGAPYITGEHTLAIAAHATIAAREAAMAQGSRFDACLIGCFGDPALHALEELGAEPVIGLAEASMRTAARRGAFAIVTGGSGWREPLRRLAFSIGLLEALVAIETVDASGAELAADPAWALERLAAACGSAMAHGARRGTPPASIIIGGAGLLGYAHLLSERVSAPLLDSVHCGLAIASERLKLTSPTGFLTSPQVPAGKSGTPLA